MHQTIQIRQEVAPRGEGMRRLRPAGMDKRCHILDVTRGYSNATHMINQRLGRRRFVSFVRTTSMVQVFYDRQFSIGTENAYLMI